MRLLAGILGAALGVVLVVGGTGALFGWLFTVFSPDRSTSASDLYELGVWAAAIAGGIIGVVVLVGLLLWLGREEAAPARYLSVWDTPA